MIRSDKSNYYSWRFDETWEYTSSFFSTYKMVDGEANYAVPGRLHLHLLVK